MLYLTYNKSASLSWRFYYVGENDYPTMEKLQQYFINKGVKHTFEVNNDIMRVILNN